MRKLALFPWLFGLVACASSPTSTLTTEEAPPIQREAGGVQLASASPSAGKEPPIRGRLSSREVTDASIVRVTVDLRPDVDPKDESKIKGVFGEKEFPFYSLSSERPGRYEAIFAVPYLHEEGPASVEVHAGESHRATLSFKVKSNQYRSEVLKVDPSKVNPPSAVLPRIKAESKKTRAIYKKVTREKMWKGAFQLPVKSVVTSPFGSQRVYNGELKGFHTGLDLRAAVGRRIRSPSWGRVVMTDDLYYTGHTVILDHGYGLYTVYAHMSRIDVKLGQRVKPNQILGLAGATGRVSGPHLHWSVVVHGERVNPFELTTVMK